MHTTTHTTQPITIDFSQERYYEVLTFNLDDALEVAGTAAAAYTGVRSIFGVGPITETAYTEFRAAADEVEQQLALLRAVIMFSEDDTLRADAEHLHAAACEQLDSLHEEVCDNFGCCTCGDCIGNAD